MNSFQQTLQQIDGGNLADDLAEKLAGLIGQVKERGKPASLAITLRIKPLDSDADSVSVVGNMKVTEPAKRERATIFFTTADNLLVRNNPAQAEMKLEPVPKVEMPLEPVVKVS